MMSTTDCNFRKHQPEVSKEQIQLLQLADVSPIHVYQCKYQVDRLITHCGMHSAKLSLMQWSGKYLHPTKEITKT